MLLADVGNGDLPPCRGVVDAVFARRGGPLTAAILTAATTTAQPLALDNLAETLFALLRSFPSVVVPQCALVLQDPAFVGNKNSTLPGAARDGVVHALAAVSTPAGLPLDPFRDLIAVLARVVQGHASIDSLASVLRGK